MIRRQSNNHWSGGIAAQPQKIPSAKIHWKSPRLDILGSRWHPLHCLSSKGPNYQRRVSLISGGAIEGLLKENRQKRGKFIKGVLFLHDNAPAHRALATQKKLAYLGFHSLDHPPYSPDLALSDYHLFRGLKNNNWKVTTFRLTRRSLLQRRPSWTGNRLNFLSILQKLKQRAKKCIELRGECVE